MLKPSILCSFYHILTIERRKSFGFFLESGEKKLNSKIKKTTSKEEREKSMSIPRHRKIPIVKKHSPEQKIPKAIIALSWFNCKKPILLVVWDIASDEIFGVTNALRKLGAKEIRIVTSDSGVPPLIKSEEFFACFQLNGKGELMFHPSWEMCQREKRDKEKKQHQRKKADDKIAKITKKGMSVST